MSNIEDRHEDSEQEERDRCALVLALLRECSLQNMSWEEFCAIHEEMGL